MNKFELTEDSIEFRGCTLFRIKALRSFSNVKKSDIGGFVEKESNLSQLGDAWIYENAKASGDAVVSGDAIVDYEVSSGTVKD